jgi:hypothetical protein
VSDGDTLQRAQKAGARLLTVAAPGRPHDTALHPAWRAFLRFCADLQHGEIERLRIQDGLPVLAEVVRKKIKFAE